jgi:integrase
MAQKKRTEGTGQIVERRGKYALRFGGAQMLIKDSAGQAVTNLRDAKRRATHTRDAIAAGAAQVAVVPAKVSAAIIGNLYEAFDSAPLRDQELTVDTMYNHKCRLGVFGRWATAQGLTVDDIDSDLAVSYLKQMTCAPATVRTHRATLMAVWEALFEARRNPWKKTQAPRLDTVNKEPFSQADQELIFQYHAELRGREKYCRRGGREFHTLHVIGRYTGMRRGDCCQLQWSSLDGSTIAVTTSKRGRPVRIPMHPVLIAELEQWGDHDDQYILPELAAWYVSDKKTLSQMLMDHLRGAGIATADAATGRVVRGFHSWRHLFVTTLIEAGVDRDLIVRIVGTSPMLLRDVYDHSETDAVLAALS